MLKVTPDLGSVFMHTLKDVYLKWQNDLEFRDLFKKNPTAALASFELTSDELQKAKKLFAGEELDKKISK